MSDTTIDIEIIKSNKHYNIEENGIKASFHFSFSEYYDPKKMSYGFLRVFNDFLVESNESDANYAYRFNTNIEIIIYIISGKLEYKDNQGNKDIILANDVFRISSGRGIIWAIKNLSNNIPLKFIEIWIYPNRNEIGSASRWDKQKISIQNYNNKLFPIIVSNKLKRENSITIKQDASIYIMELSTEKGLTHYLEKDRMYYLYPIDGKITINNNIFIDSKDAVKISFLATETMTIKNDSNNLSTIILVDLPRIF